MIDDEVKDWLIKAESDFKVIEHELKLSEDEIVKDAVCFHCQQAIEKYLKAFLIYHKVYYEKTHNIEYLLVECGKIDDDFRDIEHKRHTSESLDFKTDKKGRAFVKAINKVFGFILKRVFSAENV